MEEKIKKLVELSPDNDFLKEFIRRMLLRIEDNFYQSPIRMLDIHLALEDYLIWELRDADHTIFPRAEIIETICIIQRFAYE